MDSSCNRQVTSHLEDNVSYQRFVKPGSAEIANKEELLILGMGIVITKHYHTVSNQQVRSADYLGMQSVTACNDTCIRGD